MKGAIVGLLMGLFVYIAMVMMFNMSLTDAMFISLTIATAAGAAVAFTEREANIATVAGFVAVCIAAVVLSSIGVAPTSSAIAIVVMSSVVLIPVSILPYIAICLVAIYAVGYFINLNMKRFTLFILSCVAITVYFAVTDITIRLLTVTVAAAISAMPLLTESDNRKMVFAVVPMVGGREIIAAIDLSAFNAAALIMPLFAFIAVDPTERISSNYRSLASIAMLVIILLMLLDIMFSL